MCVLSILCETREGGEERTQEKGEGVCLCEDTSCYCVFPVSKDLGLSFQQKGSAGMDVWGTQPVIVPLQQESLFELLVEELR